MITFSQITTFTWKKGIDLSIITTNLGKDIRLKTQYRRRIQGKFDDYDLHNIIRLDMLQILFLWLVISYILMILNQLTHEHG